MIVCKCGKVYRLGSWDNPTREENETPDAEKQHWQLKICPWCRVSKIEKLKGICDSGSEFETCGVEG